MTEEEIKAVVKTDEQILAEHESERSKFEEREHFVEPCGCCGDTILK